jgi:hypothetical protein
MQRRGGFQRAGQERGSSGEDAQSRTSPDDRWAPRLGGGGWGRARSRAAGVRRPSAAGALGFGRNGPRAGQSQVGPSGEVARWAERVSKPGRTEGESARRRGGGPRGAAGPAGGAARARWDGEGRWAG